MSKGSAELSELLEAKGIELSHVEYEDNDTLKEIPVEVKALPDLVELFSDFE